MLEQRFGVAVPFSEGSRRYNIAPTETVVAIVLGKDGEPVARPLSWGLIPPWAKEAKIAHKMINARAETADRKPAYRGLIATAKRRALLPADGFYEWLRPEDRKQQRIPFRFSRADGSLFAIAGLWTPAYLPAVSPGEEGELVASVTILTTEANSIVARLHDRMPVILKPSDYDRWLDRVDAERPPVDLLKPYEATQMDAHPVDPRVGNVRNNEPGLCALWDCPSNSQ